MEVKGRPAVAALTITFVISITLIVIVLALAFILTGEIRDVGYRTKEKQAFYLAEAGIEKATLVIQSSLESIYQSTLNTDTTLAWLDSLAGLSDFVSGSLETGTYSVSILSSEAEEVLQRNLVLSSTGVAKGLSKTVQVTVAFGFNASLVFDYTYFINNYGWMYGGAQRFDGDVRANGNFSVRGTQRINGDVYASGTIDESRGSFSYDSLANYYSSASTRARPGDPASPGGEAYTGGYDAFADLYDASGNPRNPADPQLHPNETEVEMPYLGDLSYYQDLAVSENGTISQGGVTVVNNVYSGTLTLNGTTTNPIVIDGPVVVTHDVVIKGVVHGQGTIYTGRNIHVIGNLTYLDPPSWPKPDVSPEASATQNASKDLLGLCAKGNVVLGDYTSSSWNYVRNYLRPPFTGPYEVDATDASIGYVSYYQDGKPYFDGNYVDTDGGTKTDGSARRYYESSLSNAQFQALSPTNYISQIDALIYDNHATAGRIYNASFNGAIIARDEAIVFSGWIVVNYDYRFKENGPEYVDVKLPISLMVPEKKRWAD